jgi:hypothetical protein
MSLADLAARRHASSPLSYRVFGVDVVDHVVDGNPQTTPRNGHRTVAIEPRSSADLESGWNARQATRVLERRRRDGGLVMAVDYASGFGYRVHAPRNGRHVVSPDGRRIVSAVPPIARWRWERLLFAQVLPLASTLQGLELLHASAVEWQHRTVAFVARAGTGKTSTAAHVVALGGTLLTDDVLALEETDGMLVGHSGAPTLSIDDAELARMSPEGRQRLGVPVGRAEKLVLSVPVEPRANRLDGLYFLARSSTGGLEIERLDADPVRLLANSFNVYVRTPERIVNQLAIAARLTETLPVHRVRIPVGVPAPEVARAIVTHLEST